SDCLPTRQAYHGYLRDERAAGLRYAERTLRRVTTSTPPPTRATHATASTARSGIREPAKRIPASSLTPPFAPPVVGAGSVWTGEVTSPAFSSNAPISQRLPWGRRVPRWSTLSWHLVGPPSMAGLPGKRPTVSVGPPLGPRRPSLGSTATMSCCAGLVPN